MAASLARVAAASGLGLGVALAASGGREGPLYAYVAGRMVGAFTWLPPEEAHALTISLAQAGMLPHAPPAPARGPSLRTKLWGLDFPNPVGLSAGFDKHAEAMGPLLRLGFGFVEVGGVTPEPQVGNPKPRVFRLPEDGAIINRIGLSSEGHVAVAGRLAAFRSIEAANNRAGGAPGIISVNLAKNTDSPSAEADYCAGVRALGPHVDILVANVSCPNVAWTKGLAGDVDAIERLVRSVVAQRNQLERSPPPPVLLKLGPDGNLASRAHLAQVAAAAGVDGLIISNTSAPTAEGLPRDTLRSENRTEKGGLSGVPLRERALQACAEMYVLTDGKLPIVGVGGIDSGEAAYARVRAGASLLQLYTALVYKGPGLVAEIQEELRELLLADGYTDISQAVGVDAMKLAPNAASISSFDG